MPTRTSADLEHAVRSLSGAPRTLDDAAAEIPASRGLYAWWVRRGALVAVDPKAGAGTNLALFYIGIAPSRANSAATLRSRVLGNHIGGNIAASTFRFTLASLLRVELRLQAKRTGLKVNLSVDDNDKLTAWQHANARLTWFEHQVPWTLEKDVIPALAPPLNLAHNKQHPSFAVVRGARAALRASAI